MLSKKKTMLTGWLLLALATAIAAQPSQLADRIKAVENNLIPFVPVEGFESWNIEERMRFYGVKGASVAVIHNFKVDWAKAYGWADTLRQIPMTTETMLSAGSISKLLMAAGAFQLVEAGKLTLDQPINQYLSSWKLAENDFTRQTPVTLRMLLSHTGGTSQSAYYGFEASVTDLPTPLEVVSGAPKSQSRAVGVIKQPGTGFQYSGGGSMVAQLAMMDASGEQFDPLMRRLVLDPLGLQSSTFTQPLAPAYAQRASWGYQDAAWYKGTPFVYPQQAAAGLYSTPTDLANFMIELQRCYQGKGDLLTQASLREMMREQAVLSEGSYKESIAAGPFLLQRRDNTEEKGIYFTFDGANAGFTAFAIANLTEGSGVVIMLNSGNDFNALGKEIRRAVAKTYNWYKFLPEPITPITLPNNILDEYTGRYRKGPDEVLYLRREGNYLVENINQGKAIYCFPTAKDSIVFTDFNIKGWFVRDAAGRVVGIQNAYQNAPLPRMKADEFTVSELFQKGDFEAAKAQIRTMGFDEYGITYQAYDSYRNLKVARAYLEVAQELFPKSSIVLTRWGDYFFLVNDKKTASEYYNKALLLNPSDTYLLERLQELKK
jgi:CubicO group peptidase (beta-lactamase class C family)